MTTQAATPKTNKTMWMALGAGMLVLPFMLPATAKADDFRIHLNLGGPAYVQPQRVVYQDYYRPAPQRVVYIKEPRRVVYHSRPVYRERVVYRDYRDHGRGHGRGHDKHDRNDDRGNRVAWR